MIKILDLREASDEFGSARHAEISISDGMDTYLWRVGDIPVTGDPQAHLDARFNELWQAARARGEWIPTPTLNEIKTEAARQVDEEAEIARQQYATPGDLMAAIYRQKQFEVRRYQDLVDAGASPEPADYPLMSARATRLGTALQTVADEWNAKAAAWTQAAAAIEDIREQAKEDIEAAPDADAVQVVLDGLSWPAPGA